jgi:predicted membrane channel-forming protein YqfA (hemolysin III family)
MSEGHKKEEKNEEKRREKDEKEDEKRKGWDEKWRRDRVNALLWALILIWGAVVIILETTGAADDISWWQGWAVFFVGAGAILLLTAFYRLMVPEHRRAITGNVIIGLVLLAVGLGDLISWGYIWVIVLIAIALMILIRAFVPRGER